MKQEGFAIIFVFLILGLVGILSGASYSYILDKNISINKATPISATSTPIIGKAAPKTNSTTSTATTTPPPAVKPTSKPTPRPSSRINTTPIATSLPSTPSPIATSFPTNPPQPTTTTSAAAPATSSYPEATSCSSVVVSGATYGGGSIYYLSSGASATLNASTTPANGAVRWKVATHSFRLQDGGSFSANNAPTTIYTAPINTSGSDQGVEIRGDISEYPDPWLYCPPITMAIRSN